MSQGSLSAGARLRVAAQAGLGGDAVRVCTGWTGLGGGDADIDIAGGRRGARGPQG